MGLPAVIRKGLGIAKKYVRGLEETRSSYAPVSTLGRALQRISSRLAGLTPLSAVSIGFVETSGFVGVDVAFEDYFRKFYVETPREGQGLSSRGSQQAPFEVDLYIKVNYPDTPTVKVASTTYNVSDLKAEDARLIDALVMGDVFASPTQIDGVGISRPVGWSDLSSTVRVGHYVAEVIEAYS